jgi:hypothetical protein
VGISIIILPPLPENNYYCAIIDKHRILANTKSPKIALAGGSNLVYGINSTAISEKISIPVVDMGITAGIGLGRILDDISQFLHSGDVLLIIPEYEHFTIVWHGDFTAYELIFGVQQYRLLWSSYYGLPGGFSNYFSTRLNYRRSVIVQAIKQKMGQNEKEQNKEQEMADIFVLLRDGFNEYGDYVEHLGMENRPFVSSESAGILNRTYLNNFFRLVDSLTKRGITVMLSYPSYEEQSFRNSAALIQELDMLFRAKENLQVISTPESYCYPVEYFFDTVYHLNAEGRAVRTGQLIRDLQESGLLP